MRAKDKSILKFNLTRSLDIMTGRAAENPKLHGWLRTNHSKLHRIQVGFIELTENWPKRVVIRAMDTAVALVYGRPLESLTCKATELTAQALFECCDKIVQQALEQTEGSVLIGIFVAPQVAFRELEDELAVIPMVRFGVRVVDSNKRIKHEPEPLERLPTMGEKVRLLIDKVEACRVEQKVLAETAEMSPDVLRAAGRVAAYTEVLIELRKLV